MGFLHAQPCRTIDPEHIANAPLVLQPDFYREYLTSRQVVSHCVEWAGDRVAVGTGAGTDTLDRR